MPVLTMAQILDLGRKHGFTEEELPDLAAVVMTESGGKTDARQRNGLGRGLVQIDLGQHPKVTEAQAYDPDFAMAFARRLSRNKSGLGPTNWYGPRDHPAVAEKARAEARKLLRGEPLTPVQIIQAAMADPLLAGVPVEFVKGWQDRGRPYPFRPRGCVIHHTATSRRAAGDYPTLDLIIRGFPPDLPGPLSQFGLGRSGAVYVIAAGTCNHAGPGGWNGLSGNTSVWGVEAENDGIGEPWSPQALENYPRLVAALARHTPFTAADVCCHREWNPRDKIDPTGINGDKFRARVAELLAGAPTLIDKETDDMAFPLFGDSPEEREYAFWMYDGVFKKRLHTSKVWDEYQEVAKRAGRPAPIHVGKIPLATFDALTDIDTLAG